MEAEADARVTEKDYAAKRSVEETASDMISKAEAERSKRERKRLKKGPRLWLRLRKRGRR